MRADVERLDRFWEPPALDARRVRVDGADTFCLVVAQKLELELAAPAEDRFPQFVKPVVPNGRGWAFLEANATWGAGLNGCDPEAVLPAIDAATVAGTARG